MGENPSNGNPQSAGVLLFGAVVIVIGIIWYGWNYHSGGSPPAAIKVSAKELYSKYKENELKADLIYGDKTILVDGNVATSFMQFGKPNILLDIDGSWFTVQCRFNKNSQAIANLKKGDYVRIKGRCEGKSVNVFIEDCVLQ